MVTRLIARRGLFYPDVESLPVVRAAGGLSRLADDDRARLTFRRVEPGEACDDVPEESRPHLLERGDIQAIEVSE